jgi:hypothetical protein
MGHFAGRRRDFPAEGEHPAGGVCLRIGSFQTHIDRRRTGGHNHRLHKLAESIAPTGRVVAQGGPR